MKILSCGLLLMASSAFVLMGCSENTAPISSQDDGVMSLTSSQASFANEGIVHSVAGNANYWIAGKMGVLTINAKQLADETVQGRVNLVTTAFHPKVNQMRGEVVALTIYDNYAFSNGVSGPTALFWWRESVAEWGEGKYFVSFVVDKGQGKNAQDADWAGPIDGPYDAVISLTPEQINTTWPGFFVPVAVGNVVVH